MWIEDGRPVRRREGKPQAVPVRAALSRKNWLIERCSPQRVLAVEPGREFETPFDGPDAYQAAIDFAAAELRKALEGVDAT